MEILDVVLIHFNIVNNNHQRNSRVLYTFVPNKSFGQLLEIEDEINITLVINQSRISNTYKGYGFFVLCYKYG